MKIHIQKFTFNPFQENTYVLYNDAKEAIIIDPGCYTQAEKEDLKSFIESAGLTPVALLNTHAHIDHVLGNAYVLRNYDIPYYMHRADLPILDNLMRTAAMYNIEGVEESPWPSHFVEDGDSLTLGTMELKVIFGPGHAPGHVAFYSAENDLLIGGDIVFQGSFGRVDLPGGSIDILKDTILNKIFTLPDTTIIHPGHGGFTTVGTEKMTNYIHQF